MTTTKLLRQVRHQDQEALAARHNGEHRRAYRSRWVIDMLRSRLPPEHVSLAQWLAAQQAIAEGLKPLDYERVDQASNAAEGSLIARMDAQRTLYGYEAAIGSRLKRAGILCFRAIVQGDTLAETIRRCGYAAGSDRSVRQLVQVTMINAQEYDDLCRGMREANNAAAFAQCA